jgi:molybdopterin molybdotransferase
MTGAPVPPGADTVVPWEDTARDGDALTITGEARAGRHVRPRGEDLRAGDVVLSPGEVLRPVHVGVLASLGRATVVARPRARVALLSSGDEVVAPGSPLAPGHVYDANRALLTAMCEAAGARVVASDLLRDEPDAIRAWLVDAGARADLIVTTGGASVGEHDWMRAILEEMGALRLWRIAMKPGKPVAFGAIGGARVLALPGNPGSAFTGTHAFVQPAIRIMAGRQGDPPSVRARLGAAVRTSSRTLFCRVRLDGDVAHPLPAQSSVVLSNLIPADGYAIVAPGGADEGAEVTVELFA